MNFSATFAGQSARRQLAAEGKIGTSDHIVGPNQLIWRVTEERKFAVEMSIGLFEDQIRCLVEGKYSNAQIEGYEKYLTVLQAMLEEVV